MCNTFLNGEMQEEFFMHQPIDFTNPKFPNHVCKLEKVFYRLKRAPCAWYKQLAEFLIRKGFNIKTDLCPSICKRLDGDWQQQIQD